MERDGRWLLIKRGRQEAHAAGTLAGIGGKAEADGAGIGILEQTARREVAEEVGVDLTGTDLTYVAGDYFTTDDGDPVINVVFRGELPPQARPVAAAPDEEAEAHPDCPPWVLRSLRRMA
ncbi:NUDIX hydrolase [Nonomuraea sp. NPDC049400]|uniref:NUDIX hydrolase n=1 Tax=Nonomuraea sp. NPDC049400 TaxID=3364352 RepID=UPI0037972309